MEEKVIHEVRFIETEDGFRIEVKGDKERMREMGFGPGMGIGFGPGMGIGPRFGWRFRGRTWRYGRGGGWGRGYVPNFGPWGWWWDDEPVPEDEAPAE